MVLLKKEDDKSYFIAPKGTIQAVCVGAWDIGLQEIVIKGETKTLHQLLIRWELNKRIDSPGNEWDKQRYCINKTYTLSLNEKSNLYNDLHSWLTEELLEFDTDNLVGMNCLLTINHKVSSNGRTYANVSAVAPLMEGMAEMAAENVYDGIPQWVLDKYNVSPSIPALKEVKKEVKKEDGIHF